MRQVGKKLGQMGLSANTRECRVAGEHLGRAYDEGLVDHTEHRGGEDRHPLRLA